MLGRQCGRRQCCLGQPSRPGTDFFLLAFMVLVLEILFVLLLMGCLFYFSDLNYNQIQRIQDGTFPNGSSLKTL